MEQLIKKPAKHSAKLLEINANWTALVEKGGWHHFRICGRRHAESGLELEMMAVCDRGTRFWIAKSDLNEQRCWAPGWVGSEK